MNEEEITLDLRDFYYILKKRIRLIIMITLACTLVTGIFSFFIIKPTYEASATIIVGKPKGDEKSSNTQYNDVMMYQNLVKTYAKIAASNTVMESACNKLKGIIGVEQLKKSVTATPQENTQILEISAQSKNPKEAVNIVNAVVNSFVSESLRVFPTGGDIQIMDKAQFPDKPVKPKKALNMAIAFFVGLMVSVGLSFMFEYMDNTIKTEEDVSRYLDMPVIGIIPKGGV